MTSQEPGQGIWGTWGLHLLALPREQSCKQQALTFLVLCTRHSQSSQSPPTTPSPLTDPNLPPPRESQSPGKAGLLCLLPSW